MQLIIETVIDIILFIINVNKFHENANIFVISGDNDVIKNHKLINCLIIANHELLSK